MTVNNLSLNKKVSIILGDDATLQTEQFNNFISPNTKSQLVFAQLIVKANQNIAAQRAKISLSLDRQIPNIDMLSTWQEGQTIIRLGNIVFKRPNHSIDY
jgi:hypothetical protein